eukprot:UN25061
MTLGTWIVCISVSVVVVQAHNWLFSPSRAGITNASTAWPAPPQPSIRIPTVRAGIGQDFVIEWSTGHGNWYYFIIVDADDEVLLEKHNKDMVKTILNKLHRVPCGPRLNTKKHILCPRIVVIFCWRWKKAVVQQRMIAGLNQKLPITINILNFTLTIDLPIGTIQTKLSRLNNSSSRMNTLKRIDGQHIEILNFPGSYLPMNFMFLFINL